MDAKKIANDIKVKVANIDIEEIKEDIKSIDMGVALTKAQDAIATLDIEGKKQQVRDFIDSPEMDKIKGAARVVKDFVGYVPYFVQSVPGMIKDFKEKKK